MRFGANLEPGEVFTFEGEVSHGEVNLTIRLSDPEESDVLLLEGHIDLIENDVQNPNDAKDSLLDILDEIIAGYFEEERELRLIDDWRELFIPDGYTILVRGSRRNLKLERMADALLAADEVH